MYKMPIEIMSPVGSYESLMAAIQAGANSIYFGIDKLNMRSRSSENFSIKDLQNISSICLENNVKSYITLNTVMYDDDLELIKTIIDASQENHISAIIACDQSVLKIARNKDVEIHLSTQLSISNIESLKFYADYAEVVVLARELNLSQISKINEAINNKLITGPSGNLIRTEVFVHGALCLAISGKCFMSLHQHGASANRGACYQVCRREFTVIDDRGREMCLDNHFIMSPKDLCTIGILDKIIQSGVSVLKIEGRGRSPEYVKTTTSVYKQAIDSIQNGSFTKDKVKKWTEELNSVYNRGFWEGHYLGEQSVDWNTDTYGSKATNSKIYIAKGIKYFKHIKIGEFIMETGNLNIGDNVIITGQTTGLIEICVKELRIDNRPVNKVTKGDRFSMPVDKTIRNSDKVYIIKNR